MITVTDRQSKMCSSKPTASKGPKGLKHIELMLHRKSYGCRACLRRVSPKTLFGSGSPLANAATRFRTSVIALAVWGMASINDPPRALLSKQLIWMVWEAFTHKKAFSVYFISNTISLICTVFKLCCPANFIRLSIVLLLSGLEYFQITVSATIMFKSSWHFIQNVRVLLQRFLAETFSPSFLMWLSRLVFGKLY